MERGREREMEAEGRGCVHGGPPGDNDEEIRDKKKKKEDCDDFDVHMSSRSSVAVGTWVQ